METNELKTKKGEEQMEGFSLCQVFTFLSLCLCLLVESCSQYMVQNQEQWLSLTHGDELQGVCAAFCVHGLYLEENRRGSHFLLR